MRRTPDAFLEDGLVRFEPAEKLERNRLALIKSWYTRVKNDVARDRAEIDELGSNECELRVLVSDRRQTHD